MNAVEKASANHWESSGGKSFSSTIGEDAEGNIVIQSEDRAKSARARLKRASTTVRRYVISFIDFKWSIYG